MNQTNTCPQEKALQFQVGQALAAFEGSVTIGADGEAFYANNAQGNAVPLTFAQYAANPSIACGPPGLFQMGFNWPANNLPWTVGCQVSPEAMAALMQALSSS